MYRHNLGCDQGPMWWLSFRLKLHKTALSLEPHVSPAAPPAVAVDLVEAVEDARAAVAEEEDGQDDEERRARRRVDRRLRRSSAILHDFFHF